jgi:hypothetical protein
VETLFLGLVLEVILLNSFILKVWVQAASKKKSSDAECAVGIHGDDW